MKKSRKKKVAPKKPSTKIRIQSLIPGFDRLIEGGFEKYSSNLLVGGPGSGKTIFSTQFLIGGIKKGEKCLYVTFEEKKEQFYEHMKRFGWKLEDYEKKGQLYFLEYTPSKVKTMLEEGGGEIENIIIKKKISRMVIDSVTSFELLFDSEIEKREASLALFNLIRELNCTTILTFEGAPSETRDSMSSALEFESDTIILFYFKRLGKDRKRLLEILKMRGTNHSKSVHKFQINSKGISVK